MCVDLLVPAGVSPGKGRRAARLTGHDALAARKVIGLEGALVDVELRKIGALSEEDSRLFDVLVAGPAALLVAKLIKIDDRTGTERYSDKDALDVVRLLRGTDTDDLGERMNRLLADARCTDVTTRALVVLKRDFAKRDRPGVEMAIRSAGDLIDADELAMSCEILSGDLLAVLGRRD